VHPTPRICPHGRSQVTVGAQISSWNPAIQDKLDSWNKRFLMMICGDQEEAAEFTSSKGVCRLGNYQDQHLDVDWVLGGVWGTVFSTRAHSRIPVIELNPYAMCTGEAVLHSFF
jgi:hypothetical protein